MAGLSPRWQLHGYAVLCQADCIAGPDGLTPKALMNDADWDYFQRELDSAAVTLLGRIGHEVNPNRRNRRRLIVSSSARGIETRADGWWWNPADVDIAIALGACAPDGGKVAVPGGRRVFDLAHAIGWDAFHLTRARHVTVAAGIPCLTARSDARPVEWLLREAGLVPGPTLPLDPQAGFDLTIWRR